MPANDRLLLIAGVGRRKNLSNPPHLSIGEPDFYTVRMGERIGEDILHNPPGSLTTLLVLFLDNINAHTCAEGGPVPGAFGCIHGCGSILNKKVSGEMER